MNYSVQNHWWFAREGESIRQGEERRNGERRKERGKRA